MILDVHGVCLWEINMIKQSLNHIERSESLYYDEDNGGLRLDHVPAYSQIHDFKLYMKIIESCDHYELNDYSDTNVVIQLMEMSNDIARHTRRGAGNHCIVSESFYERFKESYMSLYPSRMKPFRSPSDPKRYSIGQYTIDVTLPFDDPVCIMLYNGPKRDVLDGGIGIVGNDQIVFNPQWERYIKVIQKSGNDIGRVWNMFMGDEK